LRNSCYINSIIQALLSLIPFVKILKNISPSGRLVSNFRNLILDIRNSSIIDTGIVTPDKFVTSFFNSEFLVKLFDLFDYDADAVSRNSIKQVFAGIVNSKVQCINCFCSSVKPDTFKQLIVGSSKTSNVQVQEAILQYLSVENQTNGHECKKLELQRNSFYIFSQNA
jgi:ubiquitin C-terminal hydrolase